MNWINKDKSLLYEIDEKEGVGTKPVWVEKDDIRVAEPRILKLKDEYGDPDNENMLIKGDNLLALRSLVELFRDRIEEQKVKCVYIDPPYRTGAAFSSYDDNLEHSQWLTMMRDRLILIKKLMREDGIIFISLDDNEQAYCKVLMDEIFSRENFIVNIPTIMNLKGNQDQFGFAGTHEYTLVYAKDKKKCVLYQFILTDEEELKSWEEDEIGFYKKGANLKSTGVNAPREKRPYLFYPILINNTTKEVTSITKDEYKLIFDKDSKTFNDDYISELQKDYELKGYSFLIPITNDNYMSWRWGHEKVTNEPHNIIITGEVGSFSVYKKQRPALGDLPTKKPKSFFYKPEYSSGNGTNQIKKIFGKKVFDNPKPLELIKDIIEISTTSGDLVLDSFAGSGTTGEAIFRINENEKTDRKFILIELIPNTAEKITKIRLQKVVSDNKIQKKLIKRGGLGFRYYEVGESIIKNLDMNWGMTLEEMSHAVFMNFDYSMIENDSCRMDGCDDEFYLGKQKGGIAICLVTKGTKIIRRKELNKLVKDLSKKYPNQKVTIFTNMGVAVKPEELSDKLDVKKIPESILKKYRMV